MNGVSRVTVAQRKALRDFRQPPVGIYQGPWLPTESPSRRSSRVTPPSGETREQRWAREDAQLALEMRFTDPAEAMGETPHVLYDDVLAVPKEAEDSLDETFDREIVGATARRRATARRLRAIFPRSKDDSAWRDDRAIVRRGRQRVARSLATQRWQSEARGLITTLTDEEWAALVEEYAGRCGYCGELRDVLHLDHVLARSRGGPLSIQNVIPACVACNISKNDGDVIDWLDAKGIDPDRVFDRLEEARARVRRRIRGEHG